MKKRMFDKNIREIKTRFGEEQVAKYLLSDRSY
jgi:hypothetical protein